MSEKVGLIIHHRPKEPDSIFLTRKEAALYLTSIGCHMSTYKLRRYAINNNAGRGPSFLRSGQKSIRYRRSDLDKWASKHMVYVE